MIRSHALLTTVLVLCGVCLAACSPAAPAATPTPILIAPTMTPTPVPAAENQITATNAGRMQELYKLGRGSIYGMSISPDGELLVLSTTIGVWVYRIADGEVLHYFEGEPLNWLLHHADIAWSPDGSMLAVTQKKNGVKIWDASTWELLAERIPENPDPFQPTL
ncbi:MAG: hypothetical protein OEZ02_15590, partial [Anaerolineae bacterium]|nr:hypothetical protein [Anaerolineae bacterium]